MSSGSLPRAASEREAVHGKGRPFREPEFYRTGRDQICSRFRIYLEGNPLCATAMTCSTRYNVRISTT